MQVTKCDICHKKIGHRDIVRVQETINFESFEFCGDCGKPIMKFLTDKKLIDSKNQDGKKTRKK